ncbi:MAG: DUF3576 domain-containing protein [Alphaproteobacteria bacterium]|nr:DUF3576 domain-containing protein [Alphaproteobacteria bacterium]
MKHYLSFLIMSVAFLLSACSGVDSEAKYPTGADRSATGGDIYAESPSIFGKGGLSFLGGKDKKSDGSVLVNTYLWRAALDTVSFMPLASADPFGGTIITDWYSAPETPTERTKLNVFILGGDLAVSSLSVKVFRQVKSTGGWQDAAVSNETATKLEDAIFTRAREMKIAENN